MAAAPPNFIKITILELDRLQDVTKGAKYKCYLGISTESEGFDVHSKPSAKTAPATSETNRIVWDNPETIQFALPSHAQAIVIQVKSKKGRSTENHGIVRLNLESVNTSSYNRWLPLRKNKKDLAFGSGLIHLAIEYKTMATHAANALGKTFGYLLSSHDDLVEEEKKQVSKRARKNQRKERERIVQQKINLGYKSGTINMRLFYVPYSQLNEGALCLTLVSGTNLDAKDLDGTSDPYAKITFNGHTITSPIIKSNLNPVWNYYCQYIVPQKFDLFTEMHVEIWDYDRGSTDDLIGTMDLILEDYISADTKELKEIDISFPVLKKEKPINDLLDGTKEGSAAKARKKPKLPIALIPGLASSVLVVKEGDKYWLNERIWFSLDKINQGKMQHVRLGGSLASTGQEEPDADYSIRQQKILTQNKWVDHLSLNEADNTSDPPGIKVRAMQGFEGVSYLADGIAKNMTYVMGPLIENLQEFGYTNKNLAALPYDWRIPLATLETRDGYFTQVKTTIETLAKNAGQPVVVICHSMGNRVFQYFLNYAKKYYGQDWIDKYVHTFYAVGAPFLGATKLLRALVSGERLGLDYFLSTSEALKFARTLGSFPSLLPIGVKKYWEPKSFCYVKKEDSKVLTKSKDQKKDEKTKEISIHAKNDDWILFNTEHILTVSGAEKSLEVYKKQYLANPLFGGTEDTDMAAILKAPPVKKMRHIYGVNVNTEKVYFYRLNTQKHRLDLEKRIDGQVEHFKGYQFAQGIGYETSNTPQMNTEKYTGFMKNRSGDGTVPYDSLSYCLKWREKLDLDVVELEKAEHRDIISTKVFFNLLVDYVGE